MQNSLSQTEQGRVQLAHDVFGHAELLHSFLQSEQTRTNEQIEQSSAQEVQSSISQRLQEQMIPKEDRQSPQDIPEEIR